MIILLNVRKGYMIDISGKKALITGASSGIGEAIAKDLAKQGVNLIICARRKQRLEDLKSLLQTETDVEVEILCFDVCNPNQVQQSLENLENIDILINNAGLALGVEKIEEGALDNWERMIDTNIKGLLYVSKIILQQMKKRNEGHVINIGSVAGEMVYPGGNVYCATKSAVHKISEAMNIDCVGTNIRISCVAPGAVETEFSNVRFAGDAQKADKVYEGYVPLTAQDISELTCFILKAPKHVNIQYSLIMPTAQRNPYILHRCTE
jgi:NADP-dependent 3-hydroxy acid dehydrogenase YdfG